MPQSDLHPSVFLCGLRSPFSSLSVVDRVSQPPLTSPQRSGSHGSCQVTVQSDVGPDHSGPLPASPGKEGSMVTSAFQRAGLRRAA